ncbi:MAG: response regulator, partial [Maricaulaceae bacterium]
KEPAMLILIAEDNQDNFELMARFLKRRGHEVSCATTAREAIEKAAAERPAVILMDVSLPDLSGLEATKRIRGDKALAKTPIIAVTAHAMDGDRARCMAAGCDGYLSKPIDYEALAALIDSLTSSAPA